MSKQLIDKDSVLVQVVIPKIAYLYIKKYCELFNSSISGFCRTAIVREILAHGVVDGQ